MRAFHPHWPGGALKVSCVGQRTRFEWAAVLVPFVEGITAVFHTRLPGAETEP